MQEIASRTTGHGTRDIWENNGPWCKRFLEDYWKGARDGWENYCMTDEHLDTELIEILFSLIFKLENPASMIIR